jgi:hypothetical protein
MIEATGCARCDGAMSEAHSLLRGCGFEGAPPNQVPPPLRVRPFGPFMDRKPDD